MLKLMYITNDPEIAVIAAENGVDIVFVDMEVLGKSERQGGMDTVQSHHTVEDISKVKKALNGKAQVMARLNPLNVDSKTEIDSAIENGADILMLPMWRTADDLRRFSAMVEGRAKTMPLLETDSAAVNLAEALSVPGIDMMHIGLNDLHLCLNMKFMFRLLADGTVEKLLRTIQFAEIPCGFGGVGRPGSGTLPADYIVAEHVRLGSQFVILSRSFCNTAIITDKNEIREVFRNGVADIRRIEKECSCWTSDRFEENRLKVVSCVDKIEEGINK